MALDLTDEELDALAERARQVLNAPSKQDAVRQALERVVEDNPVERQPVKDETARAERLKALRQEYQSRGTLDPDFDEKKFIDEMWGN
jgi:antitoxin VapB